MELVTADDGPGFLRNLQERAIISFFINRKPMQHLLLVLLLLLLLLRPFETRFQRTLEQTVLTF